MFADIDMPSLEISRRRDQLSRASPKRSCASTPPIARSSWRSPTAAPRPAARRAEPAGLDANDPVAEVAPLPRRAPQQLPRASTMPPSGWPQAAGGQDGLSSDFKARHNLRVRRLPPDVMLGSVRRLDRHRRAAAARRLARHGEPELPAGAAARLPRDGRRDRRALSAQATSPPRAASGSRAARWPATPPRRSSCPTPPSPAPPRRAATTRGAGAPVRHQLRADRAPADDAAEAGPGEGAVLPHPRRSGRQRLQAARRRGLSVRAARRRLPAVDRCTSVFSTPRQIVTQWLELPDGQRFFSIARTVTAGGGAFGAPRVERAIALGCAAEHAGRLIYTRDGAGRRRRGDADRRRLPRLPPPQMRRALGAADRPRTVAGRFQAAQRAVRIFGWLRTADNSASSGNHHRRHRARKPARQADMRSSSCCWPISCTPTGMPPTAISGTVTHGANSIELG